MAPPKRTKSTPNPVARNFMKARKRFRSLDTEHHEVPLEEARHPSKSDASPVSVKNKAISSKLQKQLTKKRKRVNEPPQAKKKEGIQLLKRGAVTMHRIVRRKILGIKLEVLFNAKGEPYGDAAAEMQSYIGVLARTKAPIIHDNWKKVPKERKNKIWDCVKMAFEVPPSAQKMVLNSACQKWREFKSNLTTKYILPNCDEPEILKYPPADYSFIEKGHWDMFVAGRTSPEFLEIHNKQVRRRQLNKYPHRMSRSGYANLEHGLTLDDPTMEIDRSDTWVLARQDEDGNYKNDDIKKVAEKILNMKKEVSEGSVTVSGVDDVLTKVLGNPEHRGRVRGQGVHVKQSVYFNLPRQKKKKTMDEKIQEGVQKFMAEETKKIIQERDAFWASEIEKLKAAFNGKSVNAEGSPLLDSQQGSCSRDVDVILNELNGTGGAKKKLNLDGDKIEEEANEHLGDVVPDGGVPKVDQVVVNMDVEAVDASGLEWQLAIGNPDNVVAYATMETDDSGAEQNLHGVPLAKENARVSITRVVQGSAAIPFPIQDEIKTVEEAIGTYIAWPRNLIYEMNTSRTPEKQAPKGVQKVGVKKRKNVNDCAGEYKVEMDANYPPSLKRLWNWAKDALSDGRTSHFQLFEEAFGSNKKQCLFLSDVYALCTSGEISASIICIYAHLLHENLKRHKMTDFIAFVDPGLIGAKGCGSAAERSRALSIRFRNAKKGQYFLLPYHHAGHWVLSAVNPEAQVVYHLDPLKRRIASSEWMDLVDNAIKLYKDKARKTLKKKITWENLAGVPVQNGSKDCGIFVMLYMKTICEDKDLDFSSKWLRRSSSNYFSDDDVKEVKSAWAKFFLKHHTS